jgi:hypothetical protein
MTRRDVCVFGSDACVLPPNRARTTRTNTHMARTHLEAVQVGHAVHELLEEGAGLELRQPLLPDDQVEELAPV